MEQHHEDRNGSEPGPNRTRWVLIGFLAVGGFFLVTEHRAHLYGVLPYLLILACPLMHLFHGHGKHGRSNDGAGRSANPKPGADSDIHAHAPDHGKGQS